MHDLYTFQDDNTCHTNHTSIKTDFNDLWSNHVKTEEKNSNSSTTKVMDKPQTIQINTNVNKIGNTNSTYQYSSLPNKHKNRNMQFQVETNTTKRARGQKNLLNQKHSFRKRIGVRRLVNRANTTALNCSANDPNNKVYSLKDPYIYKHGRDNPLIIVLMKNDPIILKHILSTRNPMAMAQFFESEMDHKINGNEWNSLQEYGIIQNQENKQDLYQAANYGDTNFHRDDIHVNCIEKKTKWKNSESKIQNTFNKDIHININANNSHYEIGLSESSSRFHFNGLSSCMNLDSFKTNLFLKERHKSKNFDINKNHHLDNEDITGFFVADALEESKRMQRRRDRRANVYEIESNQIDLSNDQRVKDDKRDKEMIPNAFDEENLQWISQEMEKEWIDFVEKQGSRAIFFDLNFNHSATVGNGLPFISNQEQQSCPDGKKRRGRKSYKNTFKASIVVSRGPRCDLGLFDSSIQAAKVYDMYALGRRTLGRKLKEAMDFKQRVKARMAAFKDLKQATCKNKMNPHMAAVSAYYAASKARSSLVVENFLLTDKVLFPELNFPGWYCNGHYSCPKSRIGNNSANTIKDHENPVEVAYQNLKDLLRMQEMMMNCNNPEYELLAALKIIFPFNSMIEKNKIKHSNNAQVTSVWAQGNLLDEKDKESEISRLIKNLEHSAEKTKEKIIFSSKQITDMMKLERQLSPLFNEHEKLQYEQIQLYLSWKEGRAKVKDATAKKL